MASVDYIALARGDCKVLCVTVKANGEALELGANDTVELTVRELPEPESPVLLRVTSEPGSNLLPIHEEDTLALEPGKYSADIRYKRDGCTYTIWGISDRGTRIKNLMNFYILAGVGADE